MKFDTTLTSPSHSADGAGAHRLLVAYSPDADQVGRSIALGKSAIEIGRATESLPLPDRQLSRAHAAVERTPDKDGYRIRDLGSRNGTYVNGRRVDEHTLSPEDVIRIGTHILIYQYLSLVAVEAMAETLPEEAGIVGNSGPMLGLRSAIAEAAGTGRPVLVLGESGVGKELVAAELHRLSHRQGRFVPVNCAALPEQLAESELFGHAKGAFTGATNPSGGLFGAADGGTLFLDEIGEISPALQAKLLRALANGEVRRVGETESRQVDARVVAATNVDLHEAVETGAFRGDLYARLLGAVIRVPPLRERRQDVLPLVHHFLRQEDAEVGLQPDAAEAFVVNDWPFNVRELEQVVRAAAPKARAAATLELSQLPEAVATPVRRQSGETGSEAPSSSEAPPLVLQVQRGKVPTGPELELVLKHYGGNVAQVASYFGRDRKQIYRWARRLEVDVEAFRS